jgi:hypothetical protein
MRHALRVRLPRQADEGTRTLDLPRRGWSGWRSRRPPRAGRRARWRDRTSSNISRSPRAVGATGMSMSGTGARRRVKEPTADSRSSPGRTSVMNARPNPTLNPRRSVWGPAAAVPADAGHFAAARSDHPPSTLLRSGGQTVLRPALGFGAAADKAAEVVAGHRLPDPDENTCWSPSCSEPERSGSVKAGSVRWTKGWTEVWTFSPHFGRRRPQQLRAV